MSRWARPSVVLGLVLVAACGTDRSSARDITPVTAPPSIVGAVDVLDEQRALDLAEQYVSCVNERGFEVEHVSVHELSSVGIMVKTEVDVPAAIHGECLELIGGSEVGLSSWGL